MSWPMQRWMTAYLGQLAKESNGAIRELGTDVKREAVVSEWLQLAELIKRQVIIDFTPEDLEGGRQEVPVGWCRAGKQRIHGP